MLQCDMIESSKELTDEFSGLLGKNEISFRRGIHWTTDAGYRETWGQVIDMITGSVKC